MSTISFAATTPPAIPPARRLAVFVYGCFWHSCPRHATLPKSNRPFWQSKLTANRTRDRRVDRALRKRGWRVLRIWEHSLTHPAPCARRIQNLLQSPKVPLLLADF